LRQIVISRGKLKLAPPDPEAMVPLHLYDALSWRSLEYLPHREVLAHAEPWRVNGVTAPVPDALYDLLIHCAHIAFENYRVTLGEVYHLSHVADAGVVADARRIARTHGFEPAVELLEDLLGLYAPEREEAWCRLPALVPLRPLLRCWFARLAYHARRGRPDRALGEVVQHLAFYPLLSAVRRTRGAA
jgi:hypothetical protein